MDGSLDFAEFYATILRVRGTQCDRQLAYSRLCSACDGDAPTLPAAVASVAFVRGVLVTMGAGEIAA
jgi:hypothetical protein